MTIDEAIKKIQGRMDYLFMLGEPFPHELAMAIEALKYVQRKEEEKNVKM